MQNVHVLASIQSSHAGLAVEQFEMARPCVGNLGGLQAGMIQLVTKYHASHAHHLALCVRV